MQDTIAKTWAKTRDGWPGMLLGWLGSPRYEDDDETGLSPGRIPHAERRLLALVALGFALIFIWWWWRVTAPPMASLEPILSLSRNLRSGPEATHQKKKRPILMSTLLIPIRPQYRHRPLTLLPLIRKSFCCQITMAAVSARLHCVRQNQLLLAQAQSRNPTAQIIRRKL